MAAGEMSDEEFEGFLTSFLRSALPFTQTRLCSMSVWIGAISII